MAIAVNVNFRMDPDLKRNMEEVCAEMGLSMTTAFTIFAKKVSREHRIPFEVSADPFYSESNINHLRQIVHDIDTGKAKLTDRGRLNEIALGRGSMGGLLPLADARQKAAEAYQHTSERHPAEHLRGHWKT